MPDYLIFTHEPKRDIDVTNHTIPKLRQLMDLYLDLMRPFKASKYLGVNLFTLKQSNSKSKKIIDSLERKVSVSGGDHNASRMYLVSLQKLFDVKTIKEYISL